MPFYLLALGSLDEEMENTGSEWTQAWAVQDDFSRGRVHVKGVDQEWEPSQRRKEMRSRRGKGWRGLCCISTCDHEAAPCGGLLSGCWALGLPSPAAGSSIIQSKLIDT